MQGRPWWQLAIFDWNGTLLDDLEVVAYASVCAIFEHFGLASPPLETYRTEISSDYMKFYLDHGIPPSEDPKQRQDELNDIRLRVFEENWDKPQFRDGARELLSLCYVLGMCRAIVTGEETTIFERRNRQFGLKSKWVESYIAHTRDKVAALREMLDRFRVKPKDAFYVDDSFDGLSAAKKVGLTTFGLTCGYAPEENIKAAQPDCLVSSLHEVKGILLRGARQ